MDTQVHAANHMLWTNMQTKPQLLPIPNISHSSLAIGLRSTNKLSALLESDSTLVPVVWGKPRRPCKQAIELCLMWGMTEKHGQVVLGFFCLVSR